MPRPVRVRLASLPAALALIVAAGCPEKKGVEAYSVPKPGDAPAAAAGEYRILGAVFPADEPAWFFKLAGSAEQVGKVEPAFDALVKSVRFPNGPDKAPTFDAPEGATRTGPTERQTMGVTIRTEETLKLPNGGPDVTLTQSGGGLDTNLSRWAANQLGMDVPAEGTFRKYTTPVEAGGVKGLRVALAGPKNPAGGMAGPFMKGR